MRAATYGRQSKAREDDSEGSTNSQREQTAHLVAARGWSLVAHYEDLGISGYDPTAERPGLDAMLSAAERGEIDAVVVYKLDRLTRRGVVEAVRLVDRLRAAGATLVSVNEPFFDLSTPMGVGIFGIFAALAEQESANIGARTRATKAVLRRAGSFAGGQRPYGYELSRALRDGLAVTTLTPVAAEAAVVSEVVANVLAGSSVAGEAKRLNRDRVPTARGAEWGTSTLSRLLRSPVSAGFLVERRGTGNGKGYTQVIIRDDAGEPIQAWEPIIEPATWYALQSHLDGRVGGRASNPRPTLLGGSDLLHCAHCGSPMGGDRTSGKSGAYRCMAHRRGSAKCSGATISMAHLDEWLADTVWRRAGWLDPHDPADLRLLEAVASRYGAAHADPTSEAQLRAAEAALADAESALARLDDDRSLGVFPGELGAQRYLRQVQTLTVRHEAASASLEALRAVAPADDIYTVLDLLEAMRDDLGSVEFTSSESPWSLWSIDERRDFLRLFLSDVTVRKGDGYGGGDKVQWRGHERVTITWADEVPF